MKSTMFSRFAIALALLFFSLSACQKEKELDQDLHLAAKGRPNVSTTATPINIDACGSTASSPLIAGQTTVIGNVTVSSNNGLLSVTYTITEPGWVISETHLQVDADLSTFPLTGSGNPQVGQFEYNQTHNPYVTSFTISNIDVTGLSTVTIGAHAAVKHLQGYQSNLAAIEQSLPSSSVNVNVSFTRTPSYFNTTISGGSSLDGSYLGYCVDFEHHITPGANYSMTAVSSYSTDSLLLACLVDHPENLDLINWIINQDWSGIGATGREIQAAIWTLIDNTPITSSPMGGISFNLALVNQIVNAAIANGEGFMPSCEEKVAVLLNPGCSATGHAQITMVQVQMIEMENVCTPIYTDETAWAQGADFGGSSWAMYFRYCL